ncbi:MAG: Sec-independent protein translocase subunit TatA [Candidatus Nanopelagicales bacterium]|jgi:sec-independent protein translocase protein TatA|nr:Sec-independent protein translocase subunit TatA [Candidatus Nanopelagicales bacterium]
MFSNLRGSEWLILILIVVLLFGARRLPDAARGLGRSLRIFKAETKGLAESEPEASVEAKPAEDETTPSAAAVEPPVAEQGKQAPTQT